MAKRRRAQADAPRDGRATSPGDGQKRPFAPAPHDSAPSLTELRDVNERLLIAGLREQELATALEAEHAQLALILASIGDAVLVVDNAGLAVRSNAAYAGIAGSATAPLMPMDALGQPLPPEEAPQARAARGETFTQEFALQSADGHQRWFEAKGQPLKEGGAGHAVVVIRDITSSSQNRHLQDEFLSMASHELRTPLTSVQGFIELLLRVAERADGDERILRYATLADRQVHRLAVLIRDLTDVSRLQSGKLTLVLDVVDLAPLVAGVIEVARDLPPIHTINLQVLGSQLCVRGDAGRLEQVLFNLLTNAINYSPDDTPIDVRLHQEGGEIALDVQDYGRGIAVEDLTKVFDRFYQIERGDRPSRGGMGLGLFISQEVAKAHGGIITVASIEGEGTTFTVSLPLLDAAVSNGALED